MNNDQLNAVYAQRNALAVAFVKAAVAAGWRAGKGTDHEADEGWNNVLYVDLPTGEQVSWHIAPSEVHLLEGIPEYIGFWDKTFTAKDVNWCKF